MVGLWFIGYWILGTLFMLLVVSYPKRDLVITRSEALVVMPVFVATWLFWVLWIVIGALRVAYREVHKS